MTANDPVDVLLRWENFGGTWRVVHRTGDSVTISLCRCDGGEQVEELISDSADLRAWLDEHERSASEG